MLENERYVRVKSSFLRLLYLFIEVRIGDRFENGDGQEMTAMGAAAEKEPLS